VSKVAAADECSSESLPAGARHISVARDGDVTCRVDFAVVVAAEAEVEAEAELELDGSPSSLEPVWTGSTLRMSKVAEDDCRRESPPAGSKHARVARDNVDVAVVLAAAAEADAAVEVELDGGPSSINEIERLEPVWTGSTLDRQCAESEALFCPCGSAVVFSKLAAIASVVAATTEEIRIVVTEDRSLRWVYM
jgi:hypothetical protein